MAIDVLTYNALQEVNQELKTELADLTAQVTAVSGGGGGGGANATAIDVVEHSSMLQANQWCRIPTEPAEGGNFTSGVMVCDATGYWRCNCNCTWTVPSGTTCARFQLWGPGGGSSESRCCTFSPIGSTGAYASVIMPVSAGESYTLCAGCAYCCYTERTQMTADGGTSYVQGPGLTNFCAEGGESNIFCESKVRCLRGPNEQGACKYMGSCICNTGTDYCSHQAETPGVGYPENRREASYQSTANCKTYFGTVSAGSTIYGLPGQFSWFAYDYGSDQSCRMHPGTYGFPECSCCMACMSNENGGCCWQACYCQAMCCIPGAGAWGYSTCGGDNTGCADIGKTGMVCVSYC